MKKILLIEKNEDIRSNLAQVLELVNYEVFTAGDGVNGADLALRETPDMIICGSFLPLLEGYGLLQKIQNNPSTQNSRIIFFTPKSENGFSHNDGHFNGNGHSNGHSNGYSNGHSNGHSNGDILSHQQNGHSNGISHSDMNGHQSVEASDLSKILEKIELPDNIINGIKSNAIDAIKEEVQAPIMEIKGVVDIFDLLLKDRDVNYYKKKQVIFSEGNCSRNLYFIKKGKVKTYQTNDYGKQLVVDLYAENDFIGYIPLLENTNYTEAAEALEETELLVIPRGEFNNLLKNNPEIMRLFMNLLTKSVCEKKNQMIGLAYNSLRKKVAEALVIIYTKYKADQYANFAIDISRDNLAAIAGTATESLIRTLTEFKSEKLIDIENNCIKILNKTKLESLSN